MANRMPLSSKSSRMAARRYEGASSCRAWSSGGGHDPSWSDKFPPGKTWADAKELDVWTRCRRRISFFGETRITLRVVLARPFLLTLTNILTDIDPEGNKSDRGLSDRTLLTSNLAEEQPVPSSYHHRPFRVASLDLEMRMMNLNLLNSSWRLGDYRAGNSKSARSEMTDEAFEPTDLDKIVVPVQVLTDGCRGGTQEAGETSPGTNLATARGYSRRQDPRA